MADRAPADQMVPWTVKSLPVVTRDAINQAARRENLTVGQWLERRVAEWEGAGSPVAVAAESAAVPDLSAVAATIQAALATAAAAGVAVPPAFAASALATARKAMAQARGVKPRASQPTRLAKPVDRLAAE